MAAGQISDYPRSGRLQHRSVAHGCAYLYLPVFGPKEGEGARFTDPGL